MCGERVVRKQQMTVRFKDKPPAPGPTGGTVTSTRDIESQYITPHFRSHYIRRTPTTQTSSWRDIVFIQHVLLRNTPQPKHTWLTKASTNLGFEPRNLQLSRDRKLTP